MAITLDGTAGINTSGSLTTASSLTTGTGAIYNGIQASTAVASTSGTSIDFTSIPSWVKRITVMLNNVSTNGTSVVQLQLGSGSVTTSGYVSAFQAGANLSSQTTGFGIQIFNGAADARYGAFVLTLITGNTWVSNAVISNGANSVGSQAGSIALAGTLDRVRITTVNGTDTFDAGSINIFYE
jgi:hypothetical protein